jgi:predicted DCC family thiol-disulfide oxidoreductase YuxK
MTSEHNTPVIVYDDDCGFCTWCARWAVRRGSFEAIGFANLTPDQRARLPDDFESCVHLFTSDRVYSCGAATERVLRRMYPELQEVFGALQAVPGYADFRERLYRWVADHRGQLGTYISAEPPIEKERQ